MCRWCKSPPSNLSVNIIPPCAYRATHPCMGSVDVVIGRVIAVHIKEEMLTDGILDVRKTKPIARCGYFQYAVIQETFDMVIPGLSDDV